MATKSNIDLVRLNLAWSIKRHVINSWFMFVHNFEPCDLQEVSVYRVLNFLEASCGFRVQTNWCDHTIFHTFDYYLIKLLHLIKSNRIRDANKWKREWFCGDMSLIFTTCDYWHTHSSSCNCYVSSTEKNLNFTLSHWQCMRFMYGKE